MVAADAGQAQKGAAQVLPAEPRYARERLRRTFDGPIGASDRRRETKAHHSGHHQDTAERPRQSLQDVAHVDSTCLPGGRRPNRTASSS